MGKRILSQIIGLVVCGVILNHHINRRRPAAVVLLPEPVSTMETASANEDVKEIFGVKIHSNPSQSKLDELCVASWPTWEGSPGQMPWTFTATETMYLLEGRVKVSCEGHDESFQLGAGDLVRFPKGMKITWQVIEAVKKHYKLDE